MWQYSISSGVSYSRNISVAWPEARSPTIGAIPVGLRKLSANLHAAQAVGNSFGKAGLGDTVLSPGGSCRQAVNDAVLKRIIRGLAHCSSQTSAYCQATELQAYSAG